MVRSHLLFKSPEKLSNLWDSPPSQYNHPDDTAIGKLPTKWNGDKNCLCLGHLIFLWNNWSLTLKIVTLSSSNTTSNTGGIQILQTLMKPLSLSGNGFKVSLLPLHSAFSKRGSGLVLKHYKSSNWGGYNSKSKARSPCPVSPVCKVCSPPQEGLQEGAGSLPPYTKEK